MNVIFFILMVSILFVIGAMLQRLFYGPTIYDRMNGLGVIGCIIWGAIYTRVKK